MTTVEDVKNILDTSLTDSRIDAFIASAEVITGGIDSLPQATIDEITKWLTAHFIVARTGQAVSVKAGSVAADFANVYSGRLSSTAYGQTAMSLDSTGTLSAADGRNIKLKAIPE